MNCRLYTPARGTCIHGESARDDEAARARAIRDAGVTLTLTPGERVDGFLPIRRGGTDEAAAAFVDVPADGDPLCAYRDAVTTAVESHDWGIRDDTPAGRLLAAVDTPADCPVPVWRRVRDSSDPIVGVPDATTAVAVVRALTGLDDGGTDGGVSSSASSGSTTPPATTVVVTQTGKTGAADPDVTVHVDPDAYDGPTVVDSVGRTPAERVADGLEAVRRADDSGATVAAVDDRLADLGVDAGLSYDDPDADETAALGRLLATATLAVSGLVAVWAWLAAAGPPVSVAGVPVFRRLARLLPVGIGHRTLTAAVLALGFGLALVSVGRARPSPGTPDETAAEAVVEPLEPLTAGVADGSAPAEALRTAVEGDPAFDVVESRRRRRLWTRLIDAAVVGAVGLVGWAVAAPSRRRVGLLVAVGGAVTLAVHRRAVLRTVAPLARGLARVALGAAGVVGRLVRGGADAVVWLSGVVSILTAVLWPRRSPTGAETTIHETAVQVAGVAPVGRRLALAWGPLTASDGGQTREDENGQTREDENGPTRANPVTGRADDSESPRTTDRERHRSSDDAPTHGYVLVDTSGSGTGTDTAADATTETAVQTGEPETVTTSPTPGTAAVLADAAVRVFRASDAAPTSPTVVESPVADDPVVDATVGAGGEVVAVRASGTVAVVADGDPETAAFELDRDHGERLCHHADGLTFALGGQTVVRAYRDDGPVESWRLSPPNETVVDTAVADGYLYVFTADGARHRIGRQEGQWHYHDYRLDTDEGESLGAVAAGETWAACASGTQLWYWPGARPFENETTTVDLEGVRELVVRDSDTPAVYAAAGRTVHRIDPTTDDSRTIRFEDPLESFTVTERADGTALVVGVCGGVVVTAPLPAPD